MPTARRWPATTWPWLASSHARNRRRTRSWAHLRRRSKRGPLTRRQLSGVVSHRRSIPMGRQVHRNGGPRREGLCCGHEVSPTRGVAVEKDGRTAKIAKYGDGLLAEVAVSLITSHFGKVRRPFVGILRLPFASCLQSGKPWNRAFWLRVLVLGGDDDRKHGGQQSRKPKGAIALDIVRVDAEVEGVFRCDW